MADLVLEISIIHVGYKKEKRRHAFHLHFLTFKEKILVGDS